MSFHKAKALVTGGAGFIGSNLTHRLVSLGADVTVIDSFHPGCGANPFNLRGVENAIRLVRADLREPSVSELCREVDYVFALGGAGSHADSMKAPLKDLQSNVEAQLCLLEALRAAGKQPRTVFASTRQIYGKPHYLPVDEAHPIQPPDVNAVHKVAAENLYLLYSRVYGLKSTVLRMTNTYGPRQHIRNVSQGFVGWFINRVLNNETILLYDSGIYRRDFNHVDDVVDAMLVAVTHPNTIGQIYNLAGPVATLRQIAEALVRVSQSGRLQDIPYPPERKNIELGDYFGTSKKFEETTGWRSQVDLWSGLDRTVKYYKEHMKEYLDNP